ncbi:MAG: putative DNA binding domain-containing protein [Peptococcaceae bacterium]|nr:putative DNA binding domain-containing protein [Peptococcaceae bacterium]
MTREEFLQLINDIQSLQSEMDNIEVKAAARGAPKIYDSLSALSNRISGGIIIFGLDEGNDFQATGVYDLNDLRTKIGEATVQMEPPVRPEFTSVNLDNGAVLLAVEIPECPYKLKPCYHKPAGLNGGSYIRVADGDRKMTSYEVYMFVSSRSEAQEDIQPVLRAKPEDLDAEAIDRYIKKFREKNPKSRILTYSYEQMLQRMNILIEYQGELKPTLAGMLMFGQFPQQFYPSLFIAFMMYAGTTPKQKGPRGERFLDNRRIDGTIPEMIEEVEKIIRHNMRHSTVVSGFVRQDIDEYPREALREAVINALAHRDYSHYALGSHIDIEMFADRLEVSNYGGLYGPLSEMDLGLRSNATTRNAALMRMLEDLDIVENRGSGILAMVESMRAVHLSPPHFQDKHTSFRVTFYNHTLLDQEMRECLFQFNDVPLNDNHVSPLPI